MCTAGARHAARRAHAPAHCRRCAAQRACGWRATRAGLLRGVESGERARAPRPGRANLRGRAGRCGGREGRSAGRRRRGSSALGCNRCVELPRGERRGRRRGGRRGGLRPGMAPHVRWAGRPAASARRHRSRASRWCESGVCAELGRGQRCRARDVRRRQRRGCGSRGARGRARVERVGAFSSRGLGRLRGEPTQRLARLHAAWRARMRARCRRGVVARGRGRGPPLPRRATERCGGPGAAMQAAWLLSSAARCRVCSGRAGQPSAGARRARARRGPRGAAGGNPGRAPRRRRSGLSRRGQRRARGARPPRLRAAAAGACGRQCRPRWRWLQAALVLIGRAFNSV